MKKILLALALALAGRELSAQLPPGFPGRPGGVPGVPAAPGTAGQPGPLTRSHQPLYPVTPAAPVPAATNAPESKAAPEEMIPPGLINFQGVDVSQVLDIYSQLVGRTLLRGNVPESKIILKTQTPLTKTEAIEALQAVLALNGIAVVNIGEKFVKVGPVDQANTFGAEFNNASADSLPNLGSYVTHIVQLHYVKPTEMVPIIQPFAKLANSILAIDSNGILVLRDNAENVKRMLEMIDKIDVSVPAEYVSEVIPIRYAKVDDIASALNALGGGGGATVSIGSAPAPSHINGMSGNSGGFGSMGGGIGGGIGGNNYQPGGIGGATSAFGNPAGMGVGGGGATPNGTPNGGTTFQQRLAAIVNRASGAPAGGGGGSGKDQIQLFGQTKIIPNESSSSLLIYATRPDMEVIKGIIAKLDVPLAQVLVEAVIIDYALGPNTVNFGISAAQNPTALSPGGSAVGAGGVNGANSFLNFLTGAVGTNSSSSGTFNNNAFANSLSSGLNYFGNIGSTWQVALNAVAADSHASVIQRPRIQTSQAKPAQFFVGDTVPYVTSSYGGYGGYAGNSYSQLSVGVELDVTPFINPEGMVSMDIQQEIDDLNGYTAIAGVGNVPNTIKRTLNASITVRDRDTVMLGGFIKSNKSTSRSGVPLLMDIPFLGNLFTSRSDSKQREELIVLMRPTVLDTPALAAINTIKEEQRLPEASAAAAENSADERKLADAERIREQQEFKKTGQYDGFFNPPPENTTTNAPVSTPPNHGDQEKARATLEQKMKELDGQPPAPAQP